VHAQSEDDEYDEDEGVRQFRLGAIKDRPPIFEPDAIHDILEDIAWTREAAWVETQSVTGDEPTAVGDCNDDIQRELAFYNQVRVKGWAGGVVTVRGSNQSLHGLCCVSHAQWRSQAVSRAPAKRAKPPLPPRVQALAGAHSAVAQFEGLGVAWMRPRDFYAESVKSDAHMAKVKEQFMYEQRQIEEAEQR